MKYIHIISDEEIKETEVRGDIVSAFAMRAHNVKAEINNDIWAQRVADESDRYIRELETFFARENGSDDDQEHPLNRF